MYYRESNSGHRIEWKPDYPDLAQQAMEEHKGKGVPEHVKLPDDAQVAVDRATAKSITQRYQELVARVLSLSIEDGEIATGGTDTEALTVTLEDGAGQSVTDTDYTAIIEVEGAEQEATISSGQGTLELTTQRAAGSTLSVQAVDVLEIDDARVRPSREKSIAVV